MSSKNATWLNEPSTVTEKHIKALLLRVEVVCRENGWKEGYFSKKAAGDDTVVRRMRESGRVTAAIVARVERFLDERSAT